MTAGNEAFSRVVIDAQLADQGWKTRDANSVRYEYVLPDGTRADYVLCDRHGRSMAVIEAKRFAVSPGETTEQAKAYARQLGVPYIFLANGKARPGRARSKPSSNRTISNGGSPRGRCGKTRRPCLRTGNPARPQCSQQ